MRKISRAAAKALRDNKSRPDEIARIKNAIEQIPVLVHELFERAKNPRFERPENFNLKKIDALL